MRASAERSFRDSPGASAIASHSLGLSDKMEDSGKNYAREVYEMGGQKKRVFKAKNAERELLTESKELVVVSAPTRRPCRVSLGHDPHPSSTVDHDLFRVSCQHATLHPHNP